TINGLGTFISAQASSSYVDHVVAATPDTLPTTHYQGHYSLVGLLRLPCHFVSRLLPWALFAGRSDTSACHAASRLLSGVLFVGRPDTSALPRRQSPVVRETVR
ncbi:hypothetical protein BHE74_00048934, partial [Ensete ventricosum]